MDGIQDGTLESEYQDVALDIEHQDIALDIEHQDGALKSDHRIGDVPNLSLDKGSSGVRCDIGTFVDDSSGNPSPELCYIDEENPMFVKETSPLLYASFDSSISSIDITQPPVVNQYSIIYQPGQSMIPDSFRNAVQRGNRSSYAFRNRNRENFRGSGWQDQDESGTYDPSQERTRIFRSNYNRPRRPVRADRISNEDAKSLGERPQPRAIAHEQDRRTETSLVLKFNIESDEIIEYLSAQCIEDDLFVALKKFNEADDEDGGKIRRSKEKYQIPCFDESGQVHESIRGHPEARSCVACYELGQECSLIEDCMSYPCTRCKERDGNCIYIIPPREKASCSCCDVQGIKCSFTEKDSSVEATECLYCEQQNFICLAGAAKSFRMSDVLKVAKIVPNSSTQIRYKSCDNCRKIGKKCGGTSAKYEGSCKKCCDQNVTCVFPVRPPPKSKTAKVKTQKPSKVPQKIKPPQKKTKENPREKRRLTAPKTDRPAIKPRPGHFQQKGLETRRQRKIYDRVHARTHKHKRRRKHGLHLNSDVESSFMKPAVQGGSIKYITTSYCHPITFNWAPLPPPLPSPPVLSLSHPSFPPPLPSANTTAPKADNRDKQCQFHSDPGISYALIGLGVKRVQVISWNAQSQQAQSPSLLSLAGGYEEIEDGWAEQGEDASRMCVSCTMARMLIIVCPGHEIRAIAGLDPRTYDFGAALRGLLTEAAGRVADDFCETSEVRNGEGREQEMDGQETEGLKGNEQEIDRQETEGPKEENQGTSSKNVKWCSICIMPAFYECCVRPAFTIDGIATRPGEDMGCGLLLCEVCAFRLGGIAIGGRSATDGQGDDISGEIGGGSGSGSRTVVKKGTKAILSLDEHIVAAGGDNFNYPDGLRADVEFLLSEGELMRRLGGLDLDADGEGAMTDVEGEWGWYM